MYSWKYYDLMRLYYSALLQIDVKFYVYIDLSDLEVC